MSVRNASFMVAVGWGVLILLLQLWKYSHFAYNGLDVAIYSQVMWSLTHGHGFASSIQGASYLGDHIEFILLFLAPIYKLFSSPVTLLIAQTLALVIAMWQLLRFSAERLPNKWVRISWVAIIANPIFWNVALYEFHGITLATPIVVAAIVAYTRRRFRSWVILLVLLAFWREDMGLLVAGWALLSFIDRRTRAWVITPLVLAVLSIGIMQMISGAAGEGHYKYLVFYQNLGTSWQGILLSPFQHPVIFLSSLFHPNNWAIVAGLTATVGGLCWLRKRWLLPIFFTGLQLLLLHADPRSMLRLHYFSVLVPFFIVAGIEGSSRLPQVVSAWRKKWPSIPSEMLVITMLSLFILTLIAFGPLTVVTQKKSLPTPIKSLRLALSYVEPTDSVVTSFEPLPHLSNRSQLFSLHYLFLGSKQFQKTEYQLPVEPDVVLLDRRQWFQFLSLYNKTEKDGVNGYERFYRLLQRGQYGIVFDQNDVVVWRKGAAPTVTEKKDFPSTPFEMPNLSGSITTQSPLSDLRTFVVTIAWRAKQSNDRPTVLRFRWINGDHILQTKALVLGRSDMPLEKIIAGDGGTMLSSTTLETPPTQLSIDEIRFKSNSLLQGWQSFRPVLTDFHVVGSTIVPFSPTQ